MSFLRKPNIVQNERKTMKTMIMRESLIKEAVLEEEGCRMVAPEQFNWDEEFTYCFQKSDFPRKSINQEKSKIKVQNRVNTKCDQDSVTRYLTGMKKGDLFPALVVFRDESGDILNADGIHTNEGMEQFGVETIQGIYKFSHPDPKKISALFNIRTNGVGVSLDDVLLTSVTTYMAMEQRGEPLPSRKEFAEKYRVSEEQFNKKYRQTETRKFLSNNNIAVERIVHGTAIDAIHKVKSYDEAASVKIANLAVDYNTTAKIVENIAKDYLDTTKDSVAKQNVLLKWESDLKRQTNNGKQKPAKGKRKNVEAVFRETLTKLENLSLKSDFSKLTSILVEPSVRKTALEVTSFLNKLLKIGG